MTLYKKSDERKTREAIEQLFIRELRGGSFDVAEHRRLCELLFEIRRERATFTRCGNHDRTGQHWSTEYGFCTTCGFLEHVLHPQRKRQFFILVEERF